MEADDSALKRWIAQWSDKMLQMSYLITRDSRVAEEVTQDAFFRLYQWQSAHPEESVTVGWLYAVTKNLSRDALRRRKREPVQQELDNHLPSSERFDQQLSTRMAVLSTMDELPHRDQECLFLFYYADFSLAQIANHLNVSPENVRSRLFRARQRFSELWRGDEQ
jgi:RNA polymerase sigma-70 factor (ECF subfamily)